MPRLILLARHGVHDEVGHVLSGRSEIGLNAEGRDQANALAARLAATPLAAIYSSPRRRCRETAEPVANITGLAVTTSAALDEIDVGRFTGRSFADLEHDPDWKRWNAERDTARCPGGETIAEVVARARGFIGALLAGGLPVLCVTHCDVIRGLVLDSQGAGFARMWELPCDPGSLTTMALEERRLRLVTLNECPSQAADQ